MTTPDIPLYRRMFNMARGLNKGFQLIQHVSNTLKDGDYIPPAVLCSTFCVEILLKSLWLVKYETIFTENDLKNNGIDIREHRYSRLFKNIDEDVQQEIVTTYNELYNEPVTIADFLKKFEALGDNNFVEWRYVFASSTGKTLDTQLQTKIIDSLGKTFEKINRRKKP